MIRISGTPPGTYCHKQFHSTVCENSQFQFQQTDIWKIFFHPESEQRAEISQHENALPQKTLPVDYSVSIRSKGIIRTSLF